MVETIIAGDSHEWLLSVVEHFATAPAEAAVTAYLRTGSHVLTQLEAERQGGIVRVRLTPTLSKALTPGNAVLILTAAAGDVYRKSAVVRRVFVSAAVDTDEFEHRTTAQVCLEQAEKALVDYTTGKSRVKSYTIGTRSLTFNSAQELIDLVEYWKKQVYLECCARHGRDPRRMPVEFVP